MRITYKYKQPAADGERFAEDAFNSQLGKIILMNYRETEDSPVVAPMGEARLVRADILEDGKIAELTFEILKFTGGDATDAVLTQAGGMSFAFKK